MGPQDQAWREALPLERGFRIKGDKCGTGEEQKADEVERKGGVEEPGGDD